MLIDGVLLSYQDRLQQLQAGLAQLQSRQFVTALLLGLSLALFLALAFATASRRYAPLPLPVAAVCFRRRKRQLAARLTLARLREFYTRGIARLENRWAGEGDSGEEYLAEGHVYARDLNLFGRGSLFERLSIARTEIGRRKLASYLQDQNRSAAEAAARQSAVRELSGVTALREQTATLGLDFQQSSSATFSEWLERAPVHFASWMRWLALLFSLSALAMLLAAWFVPLPLLAQIAVPLLACQATFGWTLRRHVIAVIENSRVVLVEIGLIRAGLTLLTRQNFQSPKLRGLVETIVAGNACRELRRLERYLNILNERNKEWFYGPSLLFLVGSQCALGVEAWRIRNGSALSLWIDAWGEFEALNALACYAHENPDDVFPEFETSGGAAVFDAEGLGHPLLPAGVCVRNDVRLDRANTQVLIISGSNMAGKSTLLRSVGVASVLAAAGAPVRAQRLKLSLFSTCASLSIQDAIGEGKSKFLAEVERLREAIRLARDQAPSLFLIDEIFSGTNSRDRRIAAEAVVRTLTEAGAVGAISTHDLALTEIADLEGIRGVNVHMGSRAGSSDPLDFDYLLKPGITRETNALAIARLAGVPV